ncbi:hypothetical protein MTO96_005107 [Rhipicephalus appendiculatus]
MRERRHAPGFRYGQGRFASCFSSAATPSWRGGEAASISAQVPHGRTLEAQRRSSRQGTLALCLPPAPTTSGRGVDTCVLRATALCTNTGGTKTSLVLSGAGAVCSPTRSSSGCWRAQRLAPWWPPRYALHHTAEACADDCERCARWRSSSQQTNRLHRWWNYSCWAWGLVHGSPG